MLEVANVTVTLRTALVIDAASFAAPDGAVTVLMGPSGSGKTTLLRVIAGLQKPDTGTVRWRGRVITDLPPNERHLGLMFQDYALFPHRTVAQNVAFGLRMAGDDPQAIAAEVDRLLELVGLAGFQGRQVTSLSGGEQQRVALARTLAPRPDMIMLDEPLGSLDGVTRDRLLEEMRSIFASLKLTVLYVTHDREEAFAVADQLVVIDRGRVVRSATPETIWGDPQNTFTARFIGFDDVFPADIVDGAALLPFSPVPVPVAGTGNGVVLRPGAVTIDPVGPIAGIVESVTYRGGSYEVAVLVDGGHRLHTSLAQPMVEGTEVRLSIDPGLIVTID